MRRARDLEKITAQRKRLCGLFGRNLTAVERPDNPCGTKYIVLILYGAVGPMIFGTLLEQRWRSMNAAHCSDRNI
jgi:hypothetical protein